MLKKSDSGVEPRLEDFECAIAQTARALVGSTCDARGRDFQDYTNEMRLTAWKAMSRCRDERYVLRAIWNKGRDLQRRARHVARYEVHGELPEGQYVLNLDRMVDVQTAWVQTPERERQLVMAYLSGHTFRTLAQEFGISDFTARQRFHRATEPLVEARA